jgi:hypothetical protein
VTSARSVRRIRCGWRDTHDENDSMPIARTHASCRPETCGGTRARCRGRRTRGAEVLLLIAGSRSSARKDRAPGGYGMKKERQILDTEPRELHAEATVPRRLSAGLPCPESRS